MMLKLPKIYFSRFYISKSAFFCTQVLQPKINRTFLSNKKCLLKIPDRHFWETFPILNATLYKKDDFDRQHFGIVCHTRLYLYAFYSQFFSLAVFAIQAVVGSYYAYVALVAKEALPILNVAGPFTLNFTNTAFIIYSLFTFQNVILYILAQVAALRIYHKFDTDEYVIVKLSPNPFKQKYILCKPGELEYLNRTNLVAFFGNYKLRDQKLFMHQHHFENNYHLNRMLGCA